MGNTATKDIKKDSDTILFSTQNIDNKKFISAYITYYFQKYNLSMNIPQILISIIDEFYFKFGKIGWIKDDSIKDVKHINEHRIEIKGIRLSHFIDFSFSKKELKKLTFEFIMHSYSNNSWIGFVGTPLRIQESVINGIFHLKYKQAYSLGVCDASNTQISKVYTSDDPHGRVYRQTHIKKVSFPYTSIEKIGDHFIFVIEFDKNICNVYINEINEQCRIIETETVRQNGAGMVDDKPTWSDIPDEIAICCASNQTKTEIEFHVLDYVYCQK